MSGVTVPQTSSCCGLGLSDQVPTLRYRGAIVGFGAIAQSTHVEALARAGLSVVAVVETCAQRCQVARQALPNVAIYTTLEALLAREKLDFVDICTPPHLHFDAACVAARAGVHVLCEKPLVFLHEHGVTLRRLARAHHVVISCVHNWLHAPILAEAMAQVRAGRIGALRHVEIATLRTRPAAAAGDDGNWRVDPSKAGGGILFDHGWHGMSIFLRAITAPPAWVCGRTEKRHYLHLAVEDYVEAKFGFCNSASARLVATWAADERHNTVQLIGASGRIDVCDDALQVLCGGRVIHTQRFDTSLAAGGYRPAWTAEVAREFRYEMEGRTERGTGLDEALAALDMLVATYASAARGGRRVALMGAMGPHGTGSSTEVAVAI